MNFFKSDQFVLSSDSACKLYEHAGKLPAFDFHNRLSQKLLYENR